MRCVHCGEPARYEFLLVPRGLGSWRPSYVERSEPICGGCADRFPSGLISDTCDCDEGHVCDYHLGLCPLCDRAHDAMPDEPRLCQWCERTAKAAGKSANDANRYPNPPRF